MTALPPYADVLRLRIEPGEDGPVVVMPFHEDVVGRPNYLHGGAIAGLLEFAAWTALRAALEQAGDGAVGAKPVTVTIDYLRGAGASRGEVRAKGTIRRLGNRLANVEISAWQADEKRPVAQAHAGFLLDRSAGQ